MSTELISCESWFAVCHNKVFCSMKPTCQPLLQDEKSHTTLISNDYSCTFFNAKAGLFCAGCWVMFGHSMFKVTPHKECISKYPMNYSLWAFLNSPNMFSLHIVVLTIVIGWDRIVSSDGYRYCIVCVYSSPLSK